MEKILKLGKASYRKRLDFSLFKRFFLVFSLVSLGVVLGVLFSNIFQNSYYNAWESWNRQFRDSLASISINSQELLIYVLFDKIKAYALLWLLSLTMLGLPYLYTYYVYKGFTIGFLFCLIVQEYGMKAFLVFGAYYFPQCLFYIPVFFMTFVGCREMNRQWGESANKNIRVKLKSMRSYIMMFLILLILLILGCILETYVNPTILKNLI